MEPQLPKEYHHATLVDLLDRVLERGLFLRADLVVSLAGIPLIGVSLSVAVAGTETMLKYGILADWDEAIRAVPPSRRQHLREQQPSGPSSATHVSSATPA